MIEAASAFFDWFSNQVLWPALAVVLLATHVFFTFRLGIIQRYLPAALRLSFAKPRDEAGDVSHFGALVTALAATIGAGNIVGVAVAVGSGGPGAVFWMWLTGVFGIATKYAEAFLAVRFRTRNPLGLMSGGPMYVLERGLGMRWLGIVFALFTAIAAFGIGNMFQAKAVTQQLVVLFPAVDANAVRVVAGVVMALATGAVLIGGIRWIAGFCEVLVPVMVVAYCGGCLVILARYWAELPGAVGLILSDAFTGRALAGGAIGVVIQQGVKRGLFSNESGLGSAPIAAAAAKSRNPAQQALVSSTGTFWDTVVVCLMTGLVLVVTGAWKGDARGAAMTHAAFDHIPVVGQPTLALGLLTFVFSTLIGWSYYGEKAVEYLGGVRLVPAYRWLWAAAVYVGATAPSDLVINFSDAANAMMAIPNLVALVLLSNFLARESKRELADPETYGRR